MQKTESRTDSNSPIITIRKASFEDASFVACCVLASVDLYDFKNDSIEKDVAERVCGMEDTLFSYRNARIAADSGKPVGCLVSYDGARYAEARAVTFRIFAEAGRPMDDTEFETGPGEYYIDSLAILPAYRGLGIGRELIYDAMEEARKNGLRQVGLIVECSKPLLRDYYAELGFIPVREMNAFGDRYLKMTLTL